MEYIKAINTIKNMHKTESKKISVVHVISDDLWGGAEAQCNLMIEELSLLASVALLSFNDGKLSSNLRKNSKVRVNSLNEKEGISQLLQKSCTIISELKPDIIHSHGYKEAFIACICALRFKIKWVHHIHGSSENYTGLKLIKAKMYGSLEKLLTRFFAHKIIFASEKSRLNLGYGNIEKSLVIYNAANVTYDSTANKLSDDTVRIHILGRIAPIKRVDLAISTFSHVAHNLGNSRSIELHIVGSGPLLEKMKGYARAVMRENERIHFRGFTETPTVLLKKECDILIVTSDNEGTPTTILEAMQLGIPILARSVGGIPEIKDKAPSYPLIVVKSNDPKILAEKLQEMIRDLPQLRKKAEKTNVTFFLPNRLIGELIDLYYS